MLDPLIHQDVRLRALAALHRNRELTFRELAAATQATDGNLGAHLARLQDAGYIAQAPRLTPTGFQQRYFLTPTGSARLLEYLAEIQRLLGL